MLFSGITIVFATHRCTVVGNPKGGGPWGFLANSFEGVLGVVRKSGGGGRVLLHFYVEVFQKSLKGVLEVPLLPPPVCIYDW